MKIYPNQKDNDELEQGGEFIVTQNGSLHKQAFEILKPKLFEEWKLLSRIMPETVLAVAIGTNLKSSDDFRRFLEENRDNDDYKTSKEDLKMLSFECTRTVFVLRELALMKAIVTLLELALGNQTTCSLRKAGKSDKPMSYSAACKLGEELVRRKYDDEWLQLAKEKCWHGQMAKWLETILKLATL